MKLAILFVLLWQQLLFHANTVNSYQIREDNELPLLVSESEENASHNVTSKKRVWEQISGEFSAGISFDETFKVCKRWNLSLPLIESWDDLHAIRRMHISSAGKQEKDLNILLGHKRKGAFWYNYVNDPNNASYTDINSFLTLRGPGCNATENLCCLFLTLGYSLPNGWKLTPTSCGILLFGNRGPATYCANFTYYEPPTPINPPATVINSSKFVIMNCTYLGNNTDNNRTDCTYANETNPSGSIDDGPNFSMLVTVPIIVSLCTALIVYTLLCLCTHLLCSGKYRKYSITDVFLKTYSKTNGAKDTAESEPMAKDTEAHTGRKATRHSDG